MQLHLLAFTNYLVNTLGFTHQQALLVSTKLPLRRKIKVVDSKFVDNANSVVTLFRHLGFHDALIRNIVFKEPHLLTSNVDKTLKPKIRALQDEDFSASHIIRIISRCPAMFWFGLESTILPAVHILKQVMGSVGDVVNAIQRLNDRYFRNVVKCLLPNVALLSSGYGVPIGLIRKQLLYQPGYLVRDPEVFKDILMSTHKKLGITRRSPMSLYGINFIPGMSEETFESKCMVFLSSGANQSLSNYLLYQLGFSHQQALSTCTKLSQQRKRVIGSKFVDKANSVVTLFRKHGFDDTFIRNIVLKQPLLLASNIDKKLMLKIRVLQDEGFSTFDIIRVISRRPSMLLYGLESTILPAILILKQVMDSASNVIDVIERLNERYFRNIIKCLLPNVALLTSSYGVPIELIRKQLLFQPGYFVQNPKVCKDRVMRADKKLGTTRFSPKNLYGIGLISGMSAETFESKCQIFKSFDANQSISNYLVSHLGFSQQQALSTCIKLSERRKNKVIDSKSVDNAISVVTLFYQLGFDDTLLRHIVSKQPQLLASNVDKTISPKIRILQEEGFSGSDIIKIISQCPEILFFGVESTTLPAIQILRQVMGCNNGVIEIIVRLGESYFHYVVKSLVPNVTLLTSYGVSIELIRKQLLKKPAYYVQNPEIFKDIVTRVENKLGITRNSSMFLHGINLVSGRTEETIESKCRIFKTFGWTEFNIKTFIVKNASCFTLSVESLKNKLDFLMNKLQLKPAYLISHNYFLTCSLEKRIVPRHKILLILKEKGLLENNPSLCKAICMSEPCFLKRFVLPFKEVHEAYNKVAGCNVKKLTQNSAVIIS